ncbi:MAG TPA: hypothetical protein DCY13_24140 [Verrucomicrobiales bacterium]|nr:hypothetical protein [Verrucomicrobiales bacterium]
MGFLFCPFPPRAWEKATDMKYITTDTKPAEPATPTLLRTFLVWELAAIYRRLGLAARAAEAAAVADLRMLNTVLDDAREEAA